MINDIHDIYRIIYQEKYNTSQAIDYIEKNLGQSQMKNEILTFIKSSKRGIIKRLGENPADKYNNHAAD